MRSPGDRMDASSSLRCSNWDLHQVIAVKVEQVEDVIHHGNIVAGATNATPAFANSRSLLHQAEGRPSLLIERDDLTVQNCGSRFDEIWNRAKLGIGSR